MTAFKGKQRTMILVSSVALLAGAAGSLYVFREPIAPALFAAKSAIGSSPSSPGATGAAARGQSARPSSWEIGVERVYTLDFGGSFDSDQAAPGSEFSMSMTAKVSLVAEQVDAKRVVLQARLSEVACQLGNERDDVGVVASNMSQALSRPFLVTLLANGAVESIAVDRAIEPFADAILRNVVSALQFVEPERDDAQKSAWTTEESDQNGVYRARYQRKGPREFEKTKTNYTSFKMAETVSSGDKPIRPEVKAGASFVFRPDGVIQRVAAKEELSVPLSTQVWKVSSHATFELASVSRRAVAALARDALEIERLHDTRSNGAADTPEGKRRLVQGAKFGDLARELQKIPPGKENFNQRYAVVRRLSALFDVDPDSVSDAVDKLRGKLPTEDADLLLAALSDATEPAAQTGLGELARDRAADPRIRAAAVAHLGLEDQPTQETLTNLAAMASNEMDPGLRNSATLALGGAAGHAAGDSELGHDAESTIRGLSSAADSAKSSGERQLYVSALGNAGSALGLDAIKKALSDPEASVRATAVQALRFVPGVEADQLIARIMSQDPDTNVRATAVGAAGYRVWNPILEQAAVKALKQDPDVPVRLAVVGLLEAKLLDAPVARALLEWALENDTSEDVKDAADRALHPGLASR